MLLIVGLRPRALPPVLRRKSTSSCKAFIDCRSSIFSESEVFNSVLADIISFPPKLSSTVVREIPGVLPPNDSRIPVDAALSTTLSFPRVLGVSGAELVDAYKDDKLSFLGLFETSITGVLEFRRVDEEHCGENSQN